MLKSNVSVVGPGKGILAMLGDTARLYDRLEVPTSRKFKDSTGQMIAPATIARVGIMEYRAGDCVGLDESGKEVCLFPDRDPNSMVKVMTTEAALFDEATLESARSAPVTVGHPRDAKGNLIDVDAENSKSLQKGSLEGLPVRVGDQLTATVVLNDADTINIVQEEADDLSIGQTCNLVLADEGVEWDAEKANIRINHVAIVRKGRAGDARIGDESVKLYDQDHIDGLQATIDAQGVKLADKEAKLLEAETKLADAETKLTEAKEVAFSDAVEARMELILKARMLDAKIETKGVTEVEIKRNALAKTYQGSVKLADRTDAYIAVLFDMAVDDYQEEHGLSDVQVALNDASQEEIKPPAPKEKVISPTEAARQRSIARNEHK